MIFQNVPQDLFISLRRQGYFMYHIPLKERSYQVYHVTIERILSIYQDIIIVNNMDKSINVDNQQMASLIPFRVTYIDQYRNIFALPMFIDNHTIDLIRLGSSEALRYADDDLCQAISLALMQLAKPLPYCGRLYSSIDQFPEPVQRALNEICEDPKYKRDISRVLTNDHSNPNITNDYSEYGVPHNTPLEEIQVLFDPDDIGNRGMYKAGYIPEDLENERNITPELYRTAITKEQFDDPTIKAVKKHAEYIGNKLLHPALRIVAEVDENITPEERELRSSPDIPNLPDAPILSNPIGYVIVNENTNKKSK